MPMAIPTCRNVSLMPDAIPLCSFGTTDTATSAITGLIRPMPTPEMTKPASSAVHSSVGSRPLMSSRPPPTSTRPIESTTLAGTRVMIRAPVAAETKNVVTVMGR